MSPSGSPASAAGSIQAPAEGQRSRTGCRSCRISKKKCDEARPKCSRCLARSLDCTFDRLRGVKYRNAPRRSLSVLLSSQRDGSEDTNGDSSQHRASVQTQGAPSFDDITTALDTHKNLPSLSPDASYHRPTQSSISPGQTYRQQSTTPSFSGYGGQSSSVELEQISPMDQSVHDIDAVLMAAGHTAPVMLFQTPADHLVPTPCGLPHTPSECNCPSIEQSVSPAILASISAEDIELINHYINIQSSISVACESPTNPFRQHFLPVALSMARSGQNAQNSSYHALLACSATHRANLLGTDGHTDTSALRVHAKESRATAYKILVNNVPNLASASILQRECTLGGLCLLMFLAVLDGHPLLLPPILARYRRVIAAIPHIEFSDREVFFISVCSMWQTWLDFGRLASGHPTTQPLWDLLPASARPRGQDLVSVFAVPVEICEQNLATYALVRRYEAAMRAGDLAGEIEVQLEAEDAENLLRNELEHDVAARSSVNPEIPLNGRILNGRIMHHASLRVLLLREVLCLPKEDGRVQACVKEGLRVISEVKWGSETGLLIPLLILALSASPRDRKTYEHFVDRLCWKGSAGPMSVAAALKIVQQDPSETWRSALVRLGSPILV